MARLPQKPQKGQPAIKQLYNSVCDIIDYLPSLVVNGDQKSTYVTKSSAGTVIHAAQPNLAIAKKGQEYTSGRFIRITSGNAINCILTGGTDIEITPAGVINYTGSGGGGPGSDTTYTGQYNVYSSGWISVDSSGSNPHLISSNLRYIEQLYNYPLVASSNIVMPNSLTACNNTVDISQVGTVYSNHFIQTRDILYDGLGTKVSLAWTRNPFGDVSPEGTNGIIEGLQVDLTLSGGRFADVVLHKHVFGSYDPNTGTRYDPPTESRVDCLLTGTYDHYPHTSGFIDVVPVQMEDGKTWGVISTCLHAGSGITIDNQTGEISVTGAVAGLPSPVANTVLSTTSNGTVQWTANTAGGQGGGGGCFWPMWENLCGSGNIVLVKTWYTTSTGGWLRISNKTGATVEGCNSVYIDPAVPAIVDGVQGCGVNHIGLGTGINSHFLPVPPGSSFYIEYPSGDGTRCWFDGSTSPAKTTEAVIEGGNKVINASNVAVEKAEVAQTNANQAQYYAIDKLKYYYQYQSPGDNLDTPQWYKDQYYNVYNAYNAANTAANESVQAATSCQTAYAALTAGGGTIDYSYVSNAIAASGQAETDAIKAHNMLLTAGYYYDLVYNHYLTCPNHSGWFADNPDFERYDD